MPNSVQTEKRTYTTEVSIMKQYLLLLITLYSLPIISNTHWTKFQLHQGLIFFEIETKENRTLFCLFDTGAEISAIDEKTSDELDLPIINSTTIAGSNVMLKANVVQLNHLYLKDYSVKSLSATKRDLSHSLSPNQRKVDMILGNDFFNKVIIDINFRKLEIEILSSADFLKIKYDYLLPFRMDHNIPRFSGSLNTRIKADFRLDTGASLFETDDIYINITTSDWQKIKKLHPHLAPDFNLSATGINNTQIDLPAVRLLTMSLGEIMFDNPYAIIQPETGYFGLPDAVGFISNNLLRKFSRVAIDYLNNEMHLKE